MDDKVTVRIPHELRKQLEEEAKKNNITLSSMIKFILSNYFNK